MRVGHLYARPAAPYLPDRAGPQSGAVPPSPPAPDAMPSPGKPSRAIPELPLVGRSDDLEGLYAVLGDHAEPAVVITGESGVGKSRLARTVADEAERRGWEVARGRAYPVETGVPYALLSDAFLPLVRDMDDATLAVLSRGTAAELRPLFPELRSGDPDEVGVDPSEARTRLYWHFTEFLQRLAGRQPLLVVLEDLHWADPSSLSLLHFVIRQSGDAPIRFVATFNTDHVQDLEGLLRAERSLVDLGRLRRHRLAALGRDDTEVLLERVFKLSGAPVREFASLLYGWTRGNPYFIEETLEALIEAGRLYRRDDTWLGWEARELDLPRSIRDAILARLGGVSEAAMGLAEILAVAGGRARIGVLRGVSGLSAEALTEGVEELLRRRLVEEAGDGSEMALAFRHPLLRETLYQQLSRLRARMLHGRLAEEMEALHGARAEEHADELAYHFARADAGEGDARAGRYLAVAGRSALRRHADREAAAYLEGAVARLDGADEGAGGDEGAGAGSAPEALRADLARAQARVGRYQDAEAVWSELRAAARERGDDPAHARAERQLGLLAFWRGRHEDALDAYDTALEVLDGMDEPRLEARIRMAAGVALQELGRPDEARVRIEHALRIAEAHDDAGLLARAHRALALLGAFTGEPELARAHGWRAVELADQHGDGEVRFWGRWVLAAVEGPLGNLEEMARIVSEARGVADELRSPVLQLWLAELEIEYAWATGDWDGGLARGERAITLAETLNQRTILPRLLVWTALLYLGRGALDRGEELVERAAALADMDGSGGRARDVHVAVPVFIGRAAALVARGRHRDAIETCAEGLVTADRSGYVVWVLHRLLPLMGEACIHDRDMEGARRVGTRLRQEGEAIGHRLAVAWADACDALVAWQEGDVEEGAERLRLAAEALEAIPMVPEATRLRRQYASRLLELERREEGLAELRRCHDVFERLGAQPELERVREQMREADSRPPVRSRSRGTDTLTGREVEIATLVAGRMSSKAIARELGISPRTVTTHLSNIYRKLGIGSRGELADLVRGAQLPVPRPSP